CLRSAGPIDGAPVGGLARLEETEKGGGEGIEEGEEETTTESVRPERSRGPLPSEAEGRTVEARAARSVGGMAAQLTSPQSPRISASFLARDQLFTRSSASSASARVGNSSAHISSTGRLSCV